MGSVDCLAKQVARVGPSVATTEQRTEVCLSAGLFEAGVWSDEDCDCLAQQIFAALAAGDDTCRPQCHAEGAGGPEGTS
jgi:hypothetical protein